MYHALGVVGATAPPGASCRRRAVRPRGRELLVPPTARPCPHTRAVAVSRLFGGAHVLVPWLLIAGCASRHGTLPTPPEVTETGVATRVLIPPDLNVNPAETVVQPG